MHDLPPKGRKEPGKSILIFVFYPVRESRRLLSAVNFSTYVLLRTGADTWPSGAQILNIPLATLNTFVLIGSSVTMVMSWASLQMKNFARFRLFLGLTLLCGLIFLVAKGFEYHEHIARAELPGNSTFFAIYFVMTGLHGLHVVGGLIVNGYLWGPGAKMWPTNPARFTNRIEVA